MAFLFWFLFYWNNRIEQSGYFGRIYTESIANAEINRLVVKVQTDWYNGMYIEELLISNTDRAKAWRSNHTKPEASDSKFSLWQLAMELDQEAEYPRYEDEVRDAERVMNIDLELVREGGGTNPFNFSRTGGLGRSGGINVRPRGNLPPGSGPSFEPSSRRPSGLDPSRPQSEEFTRKLRDFQTKLEAFERDARRWRHEVYECARDWYNQDIKDIEKEATKRAEDLLWATDFSAFRGRGPEFVLEFTAIVVIIFAAVILGVGAILDAQQIGTLLAAIAGYVLGRGVSRGTSGTAAQAVTRMREGGVAAAPGPQQSSPETRAAIPDERRRADSAHS